MLESRVCVQSTDARCSSEHLKSVIKADGIKAAFCNDAFLVVLTDLSAGYPNWIADIPNPPGGGEDHDRTDQSDTGIFCQTGVESMYEEFGVYKFPLTTTPLPGDDYTNNLNYKAYPNGCHRNNPGSHMCEKAGSGHDYGHPVRGPIALTVTGQEIFPVYNNVGYLAPQKCEIDTCNQHIGAGGGQTHIHGDPFGAWCMYDIDNYTSSAHHPPQIGFIFDGHGTFGRYIDTSSLGFNVPLDGCGGHDHDDFGYHYHPAIMEAVTDGGRYNPPSGTYDDFVGAGIPYLFTSPGPYLCMKGDISLIPNYWSTWEGPSKVMSNIYIVPDVTDDVCIGSKEYYVGKGLKWNPHKTMDEYEAFRAGLDDETKALIAAKAVSDQGRIEDAAKAGKALLSAEDYFKTTPTYDGDDKMTLAEALKKAAVPVVVATAPVAAVASTTSDKDAKESKVKSDAQEAKEAATKEAKEVKTGKVATLTKEEADTMAPAGAVLPAASTSKSASKEEDSKSSSTKAASSAAAAKASSKTADLAAIKGTKLASTTSVATDKASSTSKSTSKAAAATAEKTTTKTTTTAATKPALDEEAAKKVAQSSRSISVGANKSPSAEKKSA